MPENDLPPEPSRPAEALQDVPLDETIGASFNGEHKRRLVDAFRGFGWDQSKGIRMLCLAFLESAEVRDTVFRQVIKRAA